MAMTTSTVSRLSSPRSFWKCAVPEIYTTHKSADTMKVKMLLVFVYFCCICDLYGLLAFIECSEYDQADLVEVLQ
jgi:hypothetical protein